MNEKSLTPSEVNDESLPPPIPASPTKPSYSKTDLLGADLTKALREGPPRGIEDDEAPEEADDDGGFKVKPLPRPNLTEIADEPEHEAPRRALPVKRKPQVQQQVKEPIVAKDKTHKGVPAKEEIPRDEIFELEATGISEVKLDIRRQLPRGWASIRNNIRLPPKALFDVRDPVVQLTGGGVFEFSVYSVEDNERLLPRWIERYEGPPRLPPPEYTIAWDEGKQLLSVILRSDLANASAVGGFGASQSLSAGLRGPGPVYGPMQPQPPQGAQPMPTQQDLVQLAWQQIGKPAMVNGQIQPPPEGALPQWAKFYPVQQQWDMLITDRVRALEESVRSGTFQGGGAALNMANQWVHHEIRQQGDLKAENASLHSMLQGIRDQLQQKIEGVSREAQARIEREAEARARAEKELERERGQREFAILEGKLKAVELANSVPKPGLDVVGLATALGPVFAAYMQTQAQMAKLERESQMQLILAMTKKEDSLTPLIGGLGPLFAPVLVKMLDNNSPSARAQIQDMEHEQKLMQLKMMADLVASMAPAEETWQDKLVQIAMATLGRMGGGGMPQLPPPQTPRVLPSQPQPQPQQPQPNQTRSQAPPPPTLFDKMLQQDPEAAQAVQLIYSQLPMELGFHSHEWMSIIFNVQTRQMPDELAPIVCNHLVNCQNFGNLPLPLQDVFENTRGALERVFRPLPIAALDSAYVEQLIDAVASEIAELQDSGEEEDDDSNGAEDDDRISQRPHIEQIDGSRVIVTPAPDTQS